PASPTNVQTHVVKSGDTLSGIAADWGTSYQSLAAYNGISNPDVLSIGQVINYSTGSPVNYTVRSGDNLSVIAQSLGTTVSHLVSTNGLSNPNLIYPGQVLRY
ncbi:MAG: LysM domain-containing protein, partial [Bacilli bacterium]|nr:LysM domain-containing protein [Bacilli bacterium]